MERFPVALNRAAESIPGCFWLTLNHKSDPFGKEQIFQISSHPGDSPRPRSKRPRGPVCPVPSAGGDLIPWPAARIRSEPKQRHGQACGGSVYRMIRHRIRRRTSAPRFPVWRTPVRHRPRRPRPRCGTPRQTAPWYSRSAGCQTAVPPPLPPPPCRPASRSGGSPEPPPPADHGR